MGVLKGVISAVVELVCGGGGGGGVYCRSH